jgi:type VI secretion system protein ImpJ
MRQLRPVVWSKGTFLTPQHLQQQDRFIESLLEFRLEALHFKPWGFAELQIDQEALAAGNFGLSVARGIMPDGLVFDIPASDAAPPARPLAAHFGAEQTTADIFLAIPGYREHSPNVSVASRGVDARYFREPVKFRDENSGSAEKDVEVARKNFRLLMEGEGRQGTAWMRVGRVKRTGEQSFELDSKLVPPLIDISASNYAVGIVRGLVELLSAKSSILGGMRRQKNQSLAEFSATDVANFWLLYTVNTYFPELRHILETKKGHPERLFAIMLSLAGALTAFSLKIQPRDLPTYSHEDLGPCLGSLDETLRELLATVVPSNCVSLPLKLVQPSIYACALDDDKYLKNTRMYLAVSAKMKRDDLIRKAPQLMKVCSATHIDTLIRQALAGMALAHTPTPPGPIPVKMDYEYFSLSQSGAAWEAVGRARNLAAYVPSDFPDPELELLILLPEAE